ncbi:ankyrin [Xylaria scruposa]|nr:ankyrin [Xylaria scruposa]
MASLGQLPADIALQILRDLGIRDLAAIAATCCGYYILANPLLYKLELKNPESYTFYAAARDGDIGRMQRFVDAGFDVNRIWYSPFSGPNFEDIQIADLRRKKKCSEEAVVLHREMKRKRHKHIKQHYCIDSTGIKSNFDSQEGYADWRFPKFVGVAGQALGVNRAYWTPLHLAAASGQDKAVCFLIDRGASIDAPSKKFCLCPQVIAHVRSRYRGLPLWSPLHTAICRGHLQTARLLLNRGASIVVEVDEAGGLEYESNGISTDTSAATSDPDLRPQNQGRCTALHVACFHRAFEFVKALIEDGHQSELEVKDRLGQTPFAYAFCAGDFGLIMPYLLSKGCDINATLGSERGLEDSEQETTVPRKGSLLIMTCEARKYESAIELVNLGANVNCLDQATQDSALLICASHRWYDRDTGTHFRRPNKIRNQLAETLIKAGAKMDYGEITPLHSAALALDTGMVGVLIKHGADITHLPSDILHKISRFGIAHDLRRATHVKRYFNMIDILMPLGIDVNARDCENSTVLHYICEEWKECGSPRMHTLIKKLVSYGADVTLRDRFGLLPLHWIFRRDATEMGSLLEICEALFSDQLKRVLTEDDITDMFLSLLNKKAYFNTIPGLFNLLLRAGGGFLAAQPETLKMALDFGPKELAPLLINKSTFTQFVTNSNETVLHHGCQSGLFERSTIIAELLDSGVGFDANIMDANIMDADGETLLSIYLGVCRKRGWQGNFYKTIKELLKEGADPHQITKRICCDYYPDYSQCERPLDVIIGDCQFELAYEIMYKASIQDEKSDYSYLHRACSFQKAPVHEGLVRCLLGHGFDPNGISCFGETPLFHMLHTFNPGLLLKNTSYGTPRSCKDHVDKLMSCIKLLEQHGAKWNIRNKYPRHDRWTPIDELQHLLSYNGQHSWSRSDLNRLRECLKKKEWDVEDVGEDFFLFKKDETEVSQS